jgi:hypothetical protein
MSPDQEVGAALLLATVGRPGGLDPLGALEVGVPVGVPVGVLVVGAGVGAVDPVGALVVLVAAVEGGVEGAVRRARVVDDAGAGTGWTTPPAGFVVCGVVGCTPR